MFMRKQDSIVVPSVGPGGSLPESAHLLLGDKFLPLSQPHADTMGM